MEISAYITFIIPVLGFLLQFKYYRAKYFLHPSFWFFLVWILSAASFILYINVGLTYIIFYRSLIEELFVYVSFTALSFIIVSTFSYKKLRNKTVKWTPKFNEEHFKTISIVILLITLFFYVLSSGFDLIKNREQMVNNNLLIALNPGSVPLWQMIFNVLLGLNLPMLILSGFFIGNFFYIKYNNKSNKIFKNYYLYPFITGVFGTISSGGRAGIVTTLVFLVLGISLGLFKYNDVSTKLLFKFLKYGLIVFLSFSLFATYVNVIREGGKASNSQSVLRWVSYPVLQPFSALLQYMTDHYPGYQLRRVDSMSPELKLGQTSLSGITMFSIPIVSQLLHTPISIQTAFNLDAPNTVLRSEARRKAGVDWVNTTATVYFNLYEDFGYRGTFIAIFIIVIITQITFNNIFRKKKIYFLSILPLTLTYYFWSQTIFSHVILGNWTTSFIYPFLIADVISYYAKVKFYRKKIIFEDRKYSKE